MNQESFQSDSLFVPQWAKIAGIALLCSPAPIGLIKGWSLWQGFPYALTILLLSSSLMLFAAEPRGLKNILIASLLLLIGLPANYYTLSIKGQSAPTSPTKTKAQNQPTDPKSLTVDELQAKVQQNFNHFLNAKDYKQKRSALVQVLKYAKHIPEETELLLPPNQKATLLQQLAIDPTQALPKKAPQEDHFTAEDYHEEFNQRKKRARGFGYSDSSNFNKEEEDKAIALRHLKRMQKQLLKRIQ